MKKNIIKYSGITLFIYFLMIIFIYNINRNTETTIWTSSDIAPSSYVGPILNNMYLEQKFMSDKNTLEGISLLFGTFARENTSNLMITLLEGKNEIQKWEINTSKLGDNEYYNFVLDKKLKNTKNNEYIIRIETDADSDSNAIAAYQNTNIPNSDLIVSGEEKVGSSLCYKLIYSYNDKNLILYICIIITTILFIIISILLYLRDIKIQNIYLILFVCLSIFYQFVLPPNRIPDEPSHFFRAYEISEGHLISDKNNEGAGGRELPIGLNTFGTHMRISEVKELSNENISSDRTFLTFSNTSLYAPISYMPQAIGIFIGRLITNNVLALEYFGRILNMISIIVITYLSIKYIPYGKKIMLLISLLPMNIHESISLAPDGMVVALSFAMISFALYLRYNVSKLQRKHYVLMYILAIVISLYKIVYVPFCLVFFLIPKDKFGDKKNYFKHIIQVLLTVMVVSIVWLVISSNYLIEFNPGVDSASQVKLILTRPLYYIVALVRTYINNGEMFLYTMLGTQMGWLDIPINHIVLLLYLLVLIIATFIDNKSYSSNLINEKYIYFGLVFSIIMLISTSLYVQWTPVGSTLISGIQGRYFIPIIFPILILVQSQNITVNIKEITNKLMYLMVFGLNICVIVSVLHYNI